MIQFFNCNITGEIPINYGGRIISEQVVYDSFNWSDIIGSYVRNRSDLGGSDDQIGKGNTGSNRNTEGKIRSDQIIGSTHGKKHSEKPRYSAVFTRQINGLTTAVFITGENRGLDRKYQPHMAFSQSLGDMPFERRDGNVKVFQRTPMHHLHQKYLVKKFLIKYDVKSSARHILRPSSFIWISFMKKRNV